MALTSYRVLKPTNQGEVMFREGFANSTDAPSEPVGVGPPKKSRAVYDRASYLRMRRAAGRITNVDSTWLDEYERRHARAPMPTAPVDRVVAAVVAVVGIARDELMSPRSASVHNERARRLLVASLRRASHTWEAIGEAVGMHLKNACRSGLVAERDPSMAEALGAVAFAVRVGYGTPTAPPPLPNRGPAVDPDAVAAPGEYVWLPVRVGSRVWCELDRIAEADELAAMRPHRQLRFTDEVGDDQR